MAEPAHNLHEYDPEEEQRGHPSNLQSISGGAEQDESQPKTKDHLGLVPSTNSSYDEPRSASSKETPYLRAVPGIGKSDGTRRGKLSDTSKADTPEELSEKESAGAQADSGTVGTKEKSLYRKAQQSKPARGLRKARKLRGLFTKKRSVMGLIAGSVVSLCVFLFSLFQGPLQFIHFAQLLQKFHLTRNEDFGDSRAAKVLIYTLLGQAERGRLGVVSNIAADKWEKRMVERSGVRPIYYDNSGGRHAGWEIIDRDKAEASGLIKALAENIDGAEVRKVGDVDGIGVKGKAGARLSPDQEIIHYAPGKVKIGDKRGSVKTVGKSMGGVLKVASPIGSRLEKKRLGVNFHPLNFFKGKYDSKADLKARQQTQEEYDKQQQDKLAQQIEDGVHAGAGVGAASTENPDGTTSTDTQDIEASDESKKLIDDFKSSGILKTGGSAAAVVGVLCAAKGFGDNVEDYKYQNNALPMARMGWSVVSMGNQIMSNKDFSLEQLRPFSDQLYDKEKKTSWSAARSIQAENGQRATGPDIPPEAQLKNVGTKPDFFNKLDSIPALGTACSTINGFFGLPIIKEVGSVISGASIAIIDGVLSIGGTSSNELLLSALKTVSGKSVNSKAKGAERGGLANVGLYLAAQDQALTTGGVAQSPRSAFELREYQKQLAKEEKSSQPWTKRYFDIYDHSSLVGSAAMGASDINVDTLADPISTVASSFSQLASVFMPRAAATNGVYDYGIPVYGYSIEEQESDRFENPYENAAVVEPRLDELNDKYESCFSMKAVPEGDSIRLETKGYQDKDFVNIFKLSNPDKHDEYKKCHNQDDADLQRFRFYLADAVTAKSLACYEGDEAACSELGFGQSSATAGDAGGVTAGDANMQEVTTVGGRAEFIILPSKYSCPGRTTKIDSRIAPALVYLITKYNMCADDGLANGHKSHGAGLGVDLRPKEGTSKEVWKTTVEAAARDMGWWGDAADEPKSNKGCANYSGYGACTGGNSNIPKWVRWIGYNGDVDHGDPWHIFGGSYAHIHIGWASPNGGDAVAPSIISNPIPEVYTFPAPIPDDLKGLMP